MSPKPAPLDVELLRFANPAALAQTAARHWVAEVEAANRKADRHLVALSGGRIAGDFFVQSVAAAQAAGVPFTSVHFFWADERCVPPEDAESNFKLARELLLEPLKIPNAAIHRIRGEVDGGQAATEAEEALRRIAPCDHQGRPVLDLVLLGMGEDGHVASLFPGEPPHRTSSPAIYRAVVGPKPPPHRVTLGYGAIDAARQVWLLVSGAHKEVALRESLAPSGRTPLAHVLRQRAMTRIYTDIALA